MFFPSGPKSVVQGIRYNGPSLMNCKENKKYGKRKILILVPDTTTIQHNKQYVCPVTNGTIA